MLTSREIQIVTKLLENEKTLRTKDLSMKLDVSTRTIKSDLDHVRKWFQEQEIEFHAQPNKGYWIECDENERLKLYRLVKEIESKPLYPDQNIRIEKMIYFLLSTNSFITALQIANFLEVSRNTVISDLNFLDDFLKPWSITLERKSRIGYKLVGEEIHLRLLFEHLIQESLSNFDVYTIISQIKSHSLDEWSYGFTQEIQTKFEVVIKLIRQASREEVPLSVSHAEVLSIFIRLIIFLVRMESGFTIGNYQLLNSDQLESSSSKFLLKVMQNICKEFNLPLLEDEFLYIHRNFLLEDKEINLLAVTETIINHVSKKEQIPYHKDTRLFNNLLNHLSLRFEKNTTYLSEINPFSKEIKQNNSSLFMSIKEACEKFFGTNVIQDSFISFIALHFLVSYENVFNKKPKIRALYVCSTGRGVARLIKNRVEREIGDINITKYCSVTEVDEISKNEDIDLIITVFPIRSNIPTVMVDPVPTKENIQTIHDKVFDLVRNKMVDDHFIQEDEFIQEDVDYETLSQDIIIKGFEVFYEILDLLNDKISDERKKGLQIHLFLAIHRYYFHKQYDQFILQTKSNADKDLINQINSILCRHRIHINEAEQRALLQYFID